MIQDSRINEIQEALQTINTEALVAMAKWVNVKALIRKELMNRGVDINGKWVGHATARQIWGRPA